MNLYAMIQDQLAEANVSRERFRNVALHLLGHGVVMREENPSEKSLYDDARRIDALLYEYFSILGMTLHHDMNQEVMRLFPPGARAPGVTMVDESGEGTACVRQRVSVDAIAAALALRCLYEERMQLGGVEANGEALITLEDLSAVMTAQLRRPLPGGLTEKTNLLNELKRMRLIRMNPNFSAQDPEAFIGIRSHILFFVSNEALEASLSESGVSAESPSPSAQEDL